MVTLRAGTRIDVPELERDDAAADENHIARQIPLVQNVVGRDHMLRDRETAAGAASSRSR